MTRLLAITIARKPVSEGSVAANVLKHGTGGINVNGCRISESGPSPSISRRETSRRTGTTPITGLTHKDGLARGQIIRQGSPEAYIAEHSGENLGRWPANLIFQHKSECRLAGTKRVKGTAPKGPGAGAGAAHTYGDGWKPSNMNARTDNEGLETIDAWECVPGCPVADLDEQSGDVRSSGLRPTTYNSSREHTSTPFTHLQGRLYDDAGTASRFFKQVKDDSDA